MINIEKLRKLAPAVVAIGNHLPILQSMLDFEYLAGRQEPSLRAIIGNGGKYQKLFWGKSEVLIPCFARFEQMPPAVREGVNLFLNLVSGRRCHSATLEFMNTFPKSLGGHIFAEDVPEQMAADLYKRFQKEHFIIGPSGVGLLIPGFLKLGAIGGVDYRQLADSQLLTPGDVAVISASGGMTNEIMHLVASANKRCSFAIAIGGDRFPITPVSEALLAAEADPRTKQIVYYGELGGLDEYEIAELVKTGKLKKPIIAYIAGMIHESFTTPIQFGHAKALAKKPEETARAKRAALKRAGVTVVNSMVAFNERLKKLPTQKYKDPALDLEKLSERHTTLITSSVSTVNKTESYDFIGKPLTEWAKGSSTIEVLLAGLLGRPVRSKRLVDFVRSSFILAIDHGAEVSGALNTIVAARAGKDLVSAICSGLLTIGPRFGGAVSEAARNWFNGVTEQQNPAQFVEAFARKRQKLAGIGHKKYSISNPDPRLTLLLKECQQLKKSRFLDFAQKVAAITVAKKGNLILNFDGLLAAALLDLLENEEKMSEAELNELINIDFFNAFFIIPRSIGFMSHYFDQRRLDEGLFRLPAHLVSYQEKSNFYET